MKYARPLTASGETAREAYDRDGFVVPLDILDADETRALRDDLESAEAELSGDPQRLRLLHVYRTGFCRPSTRSSAMITWSRRRRRFSVPI